MRHDSEAIYKRALESGDHGSALAAVYAAGHGAGHSDGFKAGVRHADSLAVAAIAESANADAGDEAES